jgi:cytochrome P450
LHRHTPPGPKGSPLTGNLREFRGERLKLLTRLPQYGDITFMRLGTEQVYSLHHPDLIRTVLVEQSDKFQKLRLTRNLFRRALNNDAQLRQTDAWKQRREAVQSALHVKKVEAYAETVVTLTKTILHDWQPGQPLDIYQQMRKLTLQVVTRTLFGSNVTDRVRDVIHATAILQERGSRRFNSLISLPLWLPTANNISVKRAVETLDETIQHMIDSHDGQDDLLAMLLANDQITTKDLREELVSLLMSGHETTATALTWTWYLLAQHPDVSRRLCEEISQIVGSRPVTTADLHRLPYAEAVIKEAMRLYPPAWVISRKATEDVELGEYVIPKLATVFISPYSLHRDARWFDAPDTFCPERFLPTDAIPRYAYLPFGTGPRKCVGSGFAMMEAALVLVTILQQYSLDLKPGQRIIPEALITLRPKGGITMTPMKRVAS